jgi:DNA-binding beta-propeller fold protein YncE
MIATALADSEYYTVQVGSHPIGVAYFPAGHSIYVANAGSNTVSVISDNSHTVSVTGRES